MKKLAITITLLAAIVMTVSAQTTESITVCAGKQKTAKTSGLKIKFISVTEDSRCPIGVNCIWAGNAKVKVEITGPRTSKEFEFNTNSGPRGDILDGWSITIDSLTPEPEADKTIDPAKYLATFEITRLVR